MTNYGYARVSTRDQDPQLQINALAAAGCAPIVKEHASGVAKRRPVLDQLLGQLRPGDQLVVWKLDRLGRSITFLHKVIGGLAERDVSFRSLTDSIDTSTAQGRLQLNMLASFAEFERELIKERTLAGKARMRAEGRHTGGPALFGWEPDHFTIDEDEAALVRLVAKHVLAGQPLGRIVDLLNARPGWFPRPRHRERWYVTSLRRVLVNPTTAAIVGEQDHRKLVALFAPTAQRKAQGRPADNLLSGILACPCGQVLYAATKVGSSGIPQRVYRCHRGRGSGGRFNGCGRTQVAQGRADAYAEDMFVAAVTGPDFAQALAQRQVELLAGDATVEELDEWRAEVSELDQVQGTRFYTDQMKVRHADLRRMVDQATARLMAQPDLQAFADLPRTEDALQARWSSWTTAQRRVWLRRLVERIVVHPPTARRGPATDVESRMEPIFKE
jgi:DNA invertase Pin-like site-specific DNA recombinase